MSAFCSTIGWLNVILINFHNHLTEFITRGVISWLNGWEAQYRSGIILRQMKDIPFGGPLKYEPQTVFPTERKCTETKNVPLNMPWYTSNPFISGLFPMRSYTVIWKEGVVEKKRSRSHYHISHELTAKCGMTYVATVVTLTDTAIEQAISIKLLPGILRHTWQNNLRAVLTFIKIKDDDQLNGTNRSMM